MAVLVPVVNVANYTPLSLMELNVSNKLLANDKITTSCQTNLSSISKVTDKEKET